MLFANLAIFSQDALPCGGSPISWRCALDHRVFMMATLVFRILHDTNLTFFRYILVVTLFTRFIFSSIPFLTPTSCHLMSTIKPLSLHLHSTLTTSFIQVPVTLTRIIASTWTSRRIRLGRLVLTPCATPFKVFRRQQSSPPVQGCPLVGCTPCLVQ